MEGIFTGVNPIMKSEKAVTFSAVFYKATTTVDGGWTVSFHVSQSEAENIMKLSKLRDTLVQVACVPVDTDDHFKP